jgi:hypothetical protein
MDDSDEAMPLEAIVELASNGFAPLGVNGLATPDSDKVLAPVAAGGVFFSSVDTAPPATIFPDAAPSMLEEVVAGWVEVTFVFVSDVGLVVFSALGINEGASLGKIETTSKLSSFFFSMVVGPLGSFISTSSFVVVV